MYLASKMPVFQAFAFSKCNLCRYTAGNKEGNTPLIGAAWQGNAAVGLCTLESI